MTKTLLLFDVDGTLLKTGGAGMRAMRVVAQRLFGEGFRWEGIEVSGHLDPLIFAELAVINGLDDDPTHHQQFRDHYLEQLAFELATDGADVRALGGVHDTLAVLRERADREGDVALGLLTGNYTRAVPIKLGAVGIDPAWFEVTAFGDEANNRAGLVELAMAKHASVTGRDTNPDRVIVIGDTPRDVTCAHTHGCVAFAVATGPYSVDQLRQAGADVVVADLTDPTPLTERVAQAGRSPDRVITT